jgi:hypothetical protein
MLGAAPWLLCCTAFEILCETASPCHCFTDKHGLCFAETFREFFRHGSEIFMPSKEVRRAKKKERTKTRKEYVGLLR